MSRQLTDSKAGVRRHRRARKTAIKTLLALAAAACATAALAPRAAVAETHEGVQDPSAKTNLTAAEVTTILGQAASQAKPGQMIVVMDTEGITLGIVGMKGFDDNKAPDGHTTFPVSGIFSEREQLIRTAAARARTVAFFASNENAFTTRTARFIIQDHFPQPIKNTPGGPLYGVQFSSFRGSDTLRDEQSGFPALSGDPGGVPIYKNGIKAGGIGVAGDGVDIAARPELLPLGLFGSNPEFKTFQGKEEGDFDEAVALAGVKGFETPRRIRAVKIFVDGLRFPFLRNSAARQNETRTLDQITSSGDGTLLASAPLRKATPDVVASQPNGFLRTSFAGLEGELKRQFEIDAAGNKVAVANTLAAQIVDSNDTDANGTLLPAAQRLTVADVNQILNQGVAAAINTRALIREPDGVSARVHLAVVDRDGDLLAVFRMDDGPNFGYDVCIQKARTAAFFSDDSHAFSTRGVGFMCQEFFPIGIEKNSSVGGPLFEIQDRLFLTGIAAGTEPSSTNFRPLVGPNNDVRNPLRNGIQIFPGGEPLYKGGVLVGAIGISGDGVDQDERIGFGGSAGFRPQDGIRSDQLGDQDVIDFVGARLQRIVDIYDLSTGIPNVINALGGPTPIDLTGDDQLPERFRQRMEQGFHDFRLPYVRLPRNPERFDPGDKGVKIGKVKQT
jgi:uncharacterized protein GlcG (DUF336 family)